MPLNINQPSIYPSISFCSYVSNDIYNCVCVYVCVYND